MDCAVIPALSLPPLGQAIIARCVKDAAWIRSGTAQSVVELFLVTVERRMAIRPLSSSLLTSYFEVVELAMKSDFPAASLPTCKQVPQLALRTGKLWALLPEQEPPEAMLVSKAIFSSLMAIMLQDPAFLAHMIGEIVHMLKGMLLLEEFRGSPVTANGCPRLAIFRSVGVVRRSLPVRARLGVGGLLEMRFERPSCLSRCQGVTAGLLAQVLRLDGQAWIGRCLGHQSVAVLWDYICAQLVSWKSSAQVRMHALKLVSTQLLSHPASGSVYQRAILAMLHLCENLLTSKVQDEEGLAHELHRSIRCLLSAACAAAGFASEVHPVYAFLQRLVTSFPCRSQIVDGLWCLRRTVMWCLHVTVTMPLRSSARGCNALARLRGSHHFTAELAACHTAVLSRHPNSRCTTQLLCESKLRNFQAWSVYARSATVTVSSLRQCCRPSAVALSLFDKLDCRIRRYFSALLSAGLAAVRGLRNCTKLANNAADVNAICCALCTYAISLPATIRLRDCESAQVAVRALRKPQSCIAILLHAFWYIGSDVQTRHTDDEDYLRIVAVMVDTGIVLLYWLSHIDDVFGWLRPIFKLAFQKCSQHSERFGSDNLRQEACSILRSTFIVPGLASGVAIHWNATARVLSRSLIERCMQLVCWTSNFGVQRATLTSTRTDQRVAFKYILRIMDKVSDPALIFVLVQIPFLFGNFSLSVGRYCDLRGWHPLTSFFIGIVKTSATEIQVCATYGLGMLARIWCNAYGWALERGICPRPICLAFGAFSDDWDRFSFPIRRTFAYWRLFEPFWLETRKMDVIARGELIQTSAAIIRRTSKWLLFGVRGVSSVVRILWEMLPDTELSHFQRFTLGTEVGALFSVGCPKALPGTKKACYDVDQHTGGGRPSYSFDYMCHIEKEINGISCANLNISALGSIVCAVGCHLIEGRALVIYAVLEMVKNWSWPRHPNLAIAAYRELAKLPSDTVFPFKALLCREAGSHGRVVLIMLALRRGWVELFLGFLLGRSRLPRNARQMVTELLSWLVPDLLVNRQKFELFALAGLVAAGDSRRTKIGLRRRVKVLKRKRYTRALLSDKSPLERMLRYHKGLMERVLVNILINPLDYKSKLGMAEVEQRGRWLRKVLPGRENNLEGLVKRWNNNAFHWGIIWELSGPFCRRARLAVLKVIELQKREAAGAGKETGVVCRNKLIQEESRAILRTAPGDVTAALEAWVGEHFLGLMWQITHLWQQQPVGTRERRLRTLLEILICLPAQRLTRFVPKAMAIMLPNLVDDTPPQLVASSTRLLGEFACMLDNASTKEHLSAIVVAVLPILNRRFVLTVNAARARGRFHNARYTHVTEKAATYLLRLLVFDRCAATSGRFQMIPFVIRTNLSGLELVCRTFAKARGNPPLAKELKHLAALLCHDSVQIKRTTLERLNVVLGANRVQVRRMIDDNDHVVSMLISTLFAICSQNTDQQTALLCAECLGNIGAIDPAQVQPINPQLPTSKPRNARAAPWVINKKDFALLLVTDYLASALRESSSMQGQGTKIQDRIAFAIQQLLRIVRNELALKPLEPMPKDLEKTLGKASGVELIRPLWASSYELQEVKEPRQPPFLKRGCSYTRWLAQLCRYLIKRSRGPFSSIFEACRGAVKTCTNLAQFILPYLVLDSLSYGCEGDNEDMVDEFLTALRDDSGESKVILPIKNAVAIEPVVVQAVFSLTETLEEWLSVASIPIRRSRSERLRNSCDTRETHAQDAKHGWKMHPEDVDRFLQSIPKIGLARAAMRIRAYTRALRYIESIVRAKQKHVVLECMGTGNVINRLPSSSSTDIDTLQLVYSNLDEPDGMTGLVCLWRGIAEEPMPIQRIRTLEHGEQWAAALQEYEQVLQEPLVPTRPVACSGEHDPDVQNWKCQRNGELEIGVLQSLLALGHLESVLNQYDGICYRSPALRPLLAPIAIAAAWRLQRWTILSRYICYWDECAGSDEGEFEVSVAKVLRSIAFGQSSAMHVCGDFHNAMRKARDQAMKALAAASRESYQRAYPILLRLHILNEIESGVDLLKSDEAGSIEIIKQQDWAARLILLSPSLPMRAPVIAARRIVFTFAGFTNLACRDLLSLAKLARVGGNLSLAESAWRQAKFLSSSREQLRIQEAKFFHAQGQILQALQIIEPAESDLRTLRVMLQSNRGHRRAPHTATALDGGELWQLGKRLLFSTDWKVEAGHVHGELALKLYELVRVARPRWGRAYFATAKCYDLMLDARREALALEGCLILRELAEHAVRFYTESLKSGSKFIFQSMPRLLTLWFEFSPLRNVGAPQVSSSRPSRASNLVKSPNQLSDLQSTLNATVTGALQSIPSYMWYTSIQQFMSRVVHSEPTVVDIVISALILISTAHSRQSIWSVAQLFSSQNEARRKAGEHVLNRTIANLNQSKRHAESSAFGSCQLLFQDLIKNAQFQTNEKSCRLRLSPNMQYHEYVVPNQETLTVTLKPHQPARISSDVYHDPFPMSANRIHSFCDEATVMHSKARPKKISLLTTSGETASYLCKQEKNGDLRKDARLMEFNTVVNRMLQRNVGGRQRHLRLRTYCVVCLNEECGLLEWVEHTAALRTLIAEAYSIHPPIINPRFASANVRDKFCAIQQGHFGQQETAIRCRHDVFVQFTPCFHRWFLAEFFDPTAWFESRTMYTRSVAVWSAVGHIVGLGDRHCENILVDTLCAECVHVDFDCLFDKGVTLAKPEVVPFRLTSHMVDGMGITGYEGIFRRVMEVSLSVLRENQETLVSVLEPFLQDPTVGWDRLGRAQRDDNLRKRSSRQGAFVDSKKVLHTVRGRLRGIYNLRQSHMWPARTVRPKPPAGLTDSNLELSVQGQTHRLIQEATADENLCQMYVGWMPFY